MSKLENLLEAKEDRTLNIEKVNFKIPIDLCEFLNREGGATGIIGENYINLYSGAEILKLNKEYSVSEFLPQQLLIGTINDEALVIDENSNYYIVPFIGMSKKNCIKIATNFNDLLQYLFNTDVDANFI